MCFQFLVKCFLRKHTLENSSPTVLQANPLHNLTGHRNNSIGSKTLALHYLCIVLYELEEELNHFQVSLFSIESSILALNHSTLILYFQSLADQTVQGP